MEAESTPRSDDDSPSSSAHIPAVEAPPLAEIQTAQGWRVLGAGITAALLAVAVVAAPDSLVLGAVLGTLGAITGTSTLMIWHRRLRVRKDAIVETSLFGERQLRLADVDTIKWGSAGLRGPFQGLSLSGAGTTIRLRFLTTQDATSLGGFLLSHVATTLVPRLAHDLLAGKQLRVRGLRIDKEGLHTKKQHVGWHEIERVTRMPNGVMVFPRDRPDAVMLLPASMPNLPLLDALANQMVEHTTGPSLPRRVEVAGYAPTAGELGALVCGRPVQTRSRNAFLAFSGVMALTVGGALVTDAAFSSLVAILGGLFLLMGLAGALLLPVSFAVYEGGIIKGSRRMRWQDVASVTRQMVDQYVNGAYTGRLVTLVIVAKNGKKVRLHGTGGEMEAFSDAICKRLLPVLCEREGAAIAAGASLSIGKVQLKRDGVQTKKRFVRFSEVTAFDVIQGTLHLWVADAKKSVVQIGLAEKNALVALELISRVFRPEQAAPSDGVDSNSERVPSATEVVAPREPVRVR